MGQRKRCCPKRQKEEKMGVLKGISQGKLTNNGRVQERRKIKNRKALDACNGHDFRPIARKDWLYDSWYRCRRCRGEVQHTEYEWYMKGRSHSKNEGNPEYLNTESKKRLAEWKLAHPPMDLEEING